MSRPFKMKGDPMKRNFGIGVSPMKKEEEKKTFSTQEDTPGGVSMRRTIKNIEKPEKPTSKKPTGVGEGTKESLQDIARKKPALDAARSMKKEITDDLHEEVTRKDVRKARKAYKKRKRQHKRRKKIEGYESRY